MTHYALRTLRKASCVIALDIRYLAEYDRLLRRQGNVARICLGSRKHLVQDTNAAAALALDAALPAAALR